MAKRTGRREPRRGECDGVRGSCRGGPGPPECPPRAQGATHERQIAASQRGTPEPHAPPAVPGGAGGDLARRRPGVHAVGRGGYAPAFRPGRGRSPEPPAPQARPVGRPVDSAALERDVVFRYNYRPLARLLGRRNGDPVDRDPHRARDREGGRPAQGRAEPAHGRAAHRESAARDRNGQQPGRDRSDAGDALPRGRVRLRVGRPARRGIQHLPRRAGASVSTSSGRATSTARCCATTAAS